MKQRQRDDDARGNSDEKPSEHRILFLKWRGAPPPRLVTLSALATLGASRFKFGAHPRLAALSALATLGASRLSQRVGDHLRARNHDVLFPISAAIADRMRADVE